ncbi:hypothetical protein [Halogeometricum limi]|uniref:Uncharacterized protein n=1 Tax=Halogeometricum limi TaxID=555875 RepID=A0A1I6G766_9EURY|nr:hypothetical protein [Halogeometricum limi]SFR38032.1 hypothetical protein SAMN04488124_0971 [Halogeometricum limi]
MSSSMSNQRLGQVLLAGFLVLVVASILTGNAAIDTLVEVGFGFVALYFGYTTYANPRYPDGTAKTATTAAFVLAGLGQFVVVVTGLTVVDLVTTVLFVGGFVGYVLLNRQ